jgi:gas vesicle protein
MSTTSNKGDFLLGMLVGATVGAALAILYAPATGSETREYVLNAADDARHKASDLAASTVDRAQGIAGKAQDLASSVKDTAGSVADKAADVASKVKSQAQSLMTRGQDAAEKASDQIAEKAWSVMDQAKDVQESVKNQITGGNGQSDDNWASQLPDDSGEEKTGPRDLRTLETSDDPEVVADRVNDAMQGSGEEAHKIAEQLAQAPVGSQDNS